MRMRWILPVIVGLAGYVAYPYFVIAQLERAIENRDLVTLEAAIDWPQLRNSIRSNFMASVAEKMASHSSASDGAFAGAALGTVLGTAYVDRMIDATVSATGLVRALNDHPIADRVWDFVSYAFFVTPTKFRLDVTNPANREIKLTLMLSLAGGSWRVTDVILDEAIRRELAAAR